MIFLSFVAVGVDQMFIMDSGFRRTNRAHSVEERLCETLSDSAISVLITSVADAFAFGIAAITKLPGIFF
jgi:hypothetical protein